MSNVFETLLANVVSPIQNIPTPNSFVSAKQNTESTFNSLDGLTLANLTFHTVQGLKKQLCRYWTWK